jgi:hypothetical protein
VATEQIRDAYLDLERIPVPVFGFAPPIASVAHHFDLPHVDSYHLTPCGYVLLAKRIADGIIGPSLQPKAVDLSSAGIVVQSNTRLAVPVTTDLKPLAITSAPAVTKYFDVRINGGGMAAIQVEVAATAPRELRIWVPAGGLLTATSIDVRHIHGSGDGQAWGAAVSLIAAANGSAPLEPFVIRQ